MFVFQCDQCREGVNWREPSLTPSDYARPKPRPPRRSSSALKKSSRSIPTASSQCGSSRRENFACGGTILPDIVQDLPDHEMAGYRRARTEPQPPRPQSQVGPPWLTSEKGYAEPAGGKASRRHFRLNYRFSEEVRGMRKTGPDVWKAAGRVLAQLGAGAGLTQEFGWTKREQVLRHVGVGLLQLLLAEISVNTSCGAAMRTLAIIVCINELKNL